MRPQGTRMQYIYDLFEPLLKQLDYNTDSFRVLTYKKSEYIIALGGGSPFSYNYEYKQIHMNDGRKYDMVSGKFIKPDLRRNRRRKTYLKPSGESYTLEEALKIIMENK